MANNPESKILGIIPRETAKKAAWYGAVFTGIALLGLAIL